SAARSSVSGAVAIIASAGARPGVLAFVSGAALRSASARIPACIVLIPVRSASGPRSRESRSVRTHGPVPSQGSVTARGEVADLGVGSETRRGATRVGGRGATIGRTGVLRRRERGRGG